MADNVAITAGSGTTIATDDIAGVQYQRIKLGLGADGSATDAVGGAGAVSSAVQRVTLASDDPAVAALQAAIPAGTNIIGKVGIDQTTPGTTNAVAATNLPTTVDTNSGNKSASTLRVVLATDQPALTNKLLVTPDANSAVNVAQMNGVTVSMGSGANGTGVQRVTIATDDGVATAVSRLPTIVTPADSTFTRPSDTTAYAIGDLIANNTTAGSVTPLSFTGATRTGSGGTGRITRWIGQKSGSVAAVIRFHFLLTSHAVTNGDNGALVFTSLDIDNYLGAFDCVFLGSAATAIGSSSAEVVEGVPVGGAPIDYKLTSGDTIYVFAQAQAAFTPANGGTIGGRPVFEVLT